jgi:hypothetical protein
MLHMHPQQKPNRRRRRKRWTQRMEVWIDDFIRMAKKWTILALALKGLLSLILR